MDLPPEDPISRSGKKRMVGKLVSIHIKGRRFTMDREAKEVLVLVLGILPAWAISTTNDPLVFFPCLGLSWIAFLILCLSSKWSLLKRLASLFLVTLFFAF